METDTVGLFHESQPPIIWNGQFDILSLRPGGIFSYKRNELGGGGEPH